MKIANQRLLKTLDALDKAEKLNAVNDVTGAKKDSLIALDDQIIKKKDEVIAGQDILIKTYEKRKGTTISFLWGLVKIKKN